MRIRSRHYLAIRSAAWLTDNHGEVELLVIWKLGGGEDRAARVPATSWQSVLILSILH